jgi:hypothetical protein
MRNWLDLPDTDLGQGSNLGGGGKIINQSSDCVKNNKLFVRQFQYNLICFRLGKETRDAGFARSSGCAGRGKISQARSRRKRHPVVLPRGRNAAATFFRVSSEAILIPGSSPCPWRMV